MNIVTGKKSAYTTLLIFITGLLLTSGIYYQQSVHLEDKSKDLFQKSVIISLEKIKTRISKIEYFLLSNKMYFSASNFVDEKEFMQFNESYLEKKEILGICFYGLQNNYSLIKDKSQDICKRHADKPSGFSMYNSNIIILRREVFSAQNQKGTVKFIISLRNLLNQIQTGTGLSYSLSKEKVLDKKSFSIIENSVFNDFISNEHISLVVSGKKELFKHKRSLIDLFILAITFILFSLGSFTYVLYIRSLKKNSQENKLKELNEILSSTPSCLKIISKDGNLLEMNRQGLDLIEADTLESVRGANVYDLVAPEYREQFKDFNNYICEGNKGSLIFEVIALKGTRRWMETYAAPYTLPNGEKAHIAITNDISERIQNEKTYKEQKSISQQNAKLASIGEMAAGVGHEVNNPLAVIKGFISSLIRKLKTGKEIDTETLLDILYKMDTSSDRIAKIVQGLRSFTRHDNDKMYHFNPQKIIDETVEMMNILFKNEDIEIEVENNIKEKIHLYNSNEGKLQQSLVNLLSNAKDAVAENEDKVVILKLSHDKDFFNICVLDNGHGIPEEIHDKVLDPFFTTKDINKGSGLGLSLTHAFVNEIGGRISFESKKNMGSKFCIELPCKVKGQEKDSDLEPQINEIQIQNEISDMATERKFKAVIADDEHDICEILKTYLESIGFSVEVFFNGREAFQYIRKNIEELDLVLADIKMPKVDGVTLSEKIREVPKAEKLKIVLMTGGVNFDLYTEWKNNNIPIDGYIYKPFQFEKLNKLLTSLMEEKQKKYPVDLSQHH